jgi:hypothetical protein
MKSHWKILFWISIVLLIVTNLLWLYNTIDNAVGHHYYSIGCEEYRQDAEVCHHLLASSASKDEVIRLLDSGEIHYETFDKGTEFIISLHSFDLVFDKDGRLVTRDRY